MELFQKEKLAEKFAKLLTNLKKIILTTSQTSVDQ